MPCRRANSLIDIASEFGSALTGLRVYLGSVSFFFLRAIAAAS
jgi:hypothetical protein